MDAERRGRVTAIAVVVLLAFFLVDQTRLTLGYARHWANEDHTLLWYAARDLGHGRFQQPTFYGESYFTVLDSVPVEMLRRLGLGIDTAASIAAALLGMGGWLLLALGAWHRRHRVLTAAAIALPVLCTFEFLVSSEKPSGGGAGVLCAMAGVAVLVADPTRPANVAAFAVLAALGGAWDYGNVYLVVPAGVFALVVNWHARRTVVAGALGVVPAAAWLLYVRTFFRAHADYNLHKGVGYRPSVTNLRHSLPHPGRYFAWEAPELLRSVVVPLAAALFVLVLCCRTRRLRAILPAAAVVVLVVTTLAMPKAFDGTPSAYLGYGRYFLALPAAAWFLAYVYAETRPFVRPSATRTQWLVLAIVAIALVSFIGRAITFDTRLGHITKVARQPNAGAVVFPAGSIFASCRRVHDAARRADTDLVVYRFDRTGAYGCGAIEYGKLETLFPLYDRRTWIVHREDRVRRTSFLVTEIDAAWCGHARRVAGVRGCTPDVITPSLALVRTQPVPVLEVWRRLGEKVRPFEAPHAG